MTKRAVIYARVSTVEQGNGYSLDTQVEKCQKYCDDKDYQTVKVFCDKYSGTELDRPALSELIQFVADEPIDVVVVYALDRLSREPAYQAIIEFKLQESEATVDYVLGQYDDSPNR